MRCISAYRSWINSTCAVAEQRANVVGRFKNNDISQNPSQKEAHKYVIDLCNSKPAYTFGNDTHPQERQCTLKTHDVQTSNLAEVAPRTQRKKYACAAGTDPPFKLLHSHECGIKWMEHRINNEYPSNQSLAVTSRRPH